MAVLAGEVTFRYRCGPSRDSDRRSRSPATRIRSPFPIGREAELDVLEHMLTQARHGRGGSVFLVGESGVGKSCLTAEIARKAFADNVVVLRGRGNTIGPVVPFRPLTEALLSLARRGELLEDSKLGSYQAVLGRLVPDWGTGNVDDVPLLLLAEAVLRLTAAVGRGRGTLLVLENLDAADLETLAVVEYLADNLDQQGTMLLGTARADAVETADLIRLTDRRQVGTILEIHRLDRPEVVAMIGACLDVGPAEVPENLADLVWRDSSGNPLMVEELLQGMVSSGQLIRAGDGWHAADDLAQVAPADRALCARRAGEEITAAHPGLPGEWCQLTASRWLAVGEVAEAARLFADISRRISASGAAASAMVLLDRVRAQLAALGDVPGRAEALQTLLSARAEANEVERAPRTAKDPASHNAGLDAARLVALRGVGTLASQRRTGTVTIPGALRVYGVTRREYEVLELLVFRFGNKEIAARLHISPRTVEKHVASLLSRTGQADRAHLIDHATAVLLTI